MSPEEEKEKKRKKREIIIAVNNGFLIYCFTGLGICFFLLLFGLVVFILMKLGIVKGSDESPDWLMIPILAFIFFGGGNFGVKFYERYLKKWYMEKINKREDKRDEKRRAKEAAKKAKEEKKG